jgi:hypothetical protein
MVLIEVLKPAKTMPPDLRHFMTPADAPNASDGPLAAIKPPEDLAAQPTGTASRTRRVPAPAQRQPGARSIIAAAPQSLALRSAQSPGSPSPEPFDPHSWQHRATV